MSAAPDRAIGGVPSLLVPPSGAVTDTDWHIGALMLFGLAAAAALSAAALTSSLVRRAGRERISAPAAGVQGIGAAGELRVDRAKLAALATVSQQPRRADKVGTELAAWPREASCSIPPAIAVDTS